MAEICAIDFSYPTSYSSHDLRVGRSTGSCMPSARFQAMTTFHQHNKHFTFTIMPSCTLQAMIISQTEILVSFGLEGENAHTDCCVTAQACLHIHSLTCSSGDLHSEDRVYVDKGHGAKPTRLVFVVWLRVLDLMFPEKCTWKNCQKAQFFPRFTIFRS